MTRQTEALDFDGLQANLLAFFTKSIWSKSITRRGRPHQRSRGGRGKMSPTFEPRHVPQTNQLEKPH